MSTFLEVGPGRVLTGLIKKTDRSVRVLNVEDSDSLGSFEAAWESVSNQSE